MPTILITEADRRRFRAEARQVVPPTVPRWRQYPRWLREAALDRYVTLKCEELKATKGATQ